jgi:hypothetical protein
MGFLGSNFISNAWRVHSAANVQDALLRSAEGFAGRMATNTFDEFRPDKRVTSFTSTIRLPKQSSENELSR